MRRVPLTIICAEHPIDCFSHALYADYTCWFVGSHLAHFSPQRCADSPKAFVETKLRSSKLDPLS